jgi:hypothetical protein
MRPFALVLLVAVLAGCSSPAPATDSHTHAATDSMTATGQIPVAPLPPPPPALLQLGACSQFHTFFPFPKAALQQLGFTVPEGFAMQGSDPADATVDVFLAWWLCPDGNLTGPAPSRLGPVHAMLAALPVVPPSDLRNQSVEMDLAGLTWVVSSQPVADFLASFNLTGVVQKGPVTKDMEGSFGGAVHQTTLSATTGIGTFTLDAFVQDDPAPFGASAYRLWIAPDGKAIGHLDIQNQPGRTVGSGAAGLRFVGDPTSGAPPFTPGTSHQVAGIGITVRHVALPKA